MACEFPMKVRFGEEPTTEYYDSLNNLRLILLSKPSEGFRERCVEMMKATWADEPVNQFSLSKEEVHAQFMKILKFKVLPNSLEHIQFQFRVEGLTLVEVTHLLRHRMFSSIHAQCSADRFLQHDSVFIPSSIERTEFAERYKSLTEECKHLYIDMVDSKKISILDARYILTRNHRYFYYFGCNLKDAIAFINQRKCTGIQPEMDNLFAEQMYQCIQLCIPEIKSVVHLDCGPSCVYVTSDGEDSSRVNYPDQVHAKLISDKFGEDSERLKPEYYLMNSMTRKSMGIDYEQSIPIIGDSSQV
ncbi:MAG: FAD-dependent thymidylate synthase [Scytonema sp. CRU_2_7]|nr:FAD-dependent thymidylate synthase [Scytonema sp. CRU_2_7]